MLEDVWQHRDFPTLLEVARRADVNPTGLWLPVQEVEQATGLEPDKVQQAAWSLSKAELAEVDARDTIIVAFTGITPAARERVGLWPTVDVAADRLIESLAQAVKDASTPEERSKRQKVLSALLETGRDFIVSVASGVLTGRITGS